MVFIPEQYEFDLTVATKPTSTTSGEPTHNLVPGDVIEVCEGELIHLQGKIIRTDGNKITMMPKHEDLKVSLSSYTSFQYNLFW